MEGGVEKARHQGSVGAGSTEKRKGKGGTEGEEGA
jgi:hypothetical protein